MGGTDLFQANTLIPGTYDAQNTNSLEEFYGTATNVTEDIVHNQIDFDGILINTPNHKSADTFLNVNMTNLTIEPAPASGSSRIARRPTAASPAPSTPATAPTPTSGTPAAR